MSRKLASIQSISDIKPIEGADRIECVTILGWECVVKKDEFKVGDKVIYIEVDSVLPERPEFEFMRDRKFKVKTIKLRKQISQGMCFPMTILPPGQYDIGTEVTEILGITKYDPQAISEAIEAEKENLKKTKFQKFMMQFKLYRNFIYKKKKEMWPEFIPKTDEERIQNMSFIINNNKDRIFTVTEKLDGQSATYALKKLPRKLWQIKPKYQFYVCSRNIHLKTPHQCSYWSIAEQYNIKTVLQDLIGKFDCIILQGEIIGQGIQKNRYNVTGYDFYAFNLIFPTGRLWHTYMESLLKDRVKVVPKIGSLKLEETIPDCVEKIAKGKSTLANIQREGVVMRNDNLSFKIINPEYLLKYDD
jgi:L-rhamnose mutarotase